MKIVFVQTSDTVNYSRMLSITSRTVIEYCKRHDYQFEVFMGIKRGVHPWHAVYNRIFMIRDMIQRGYTGWVVYMDADSYILDLNYDLKSYLSDKQDFAFIAAPSGAAAHLWYIINDGVFMMNLAHPAANQIVQAWYDKFMAISAEQLAAASVWGSVPSDQTILVEYLKTQPQLESVCLTQANVASVINSPVSKFIRQILRAHADEGMASRLKLIEKAVSDILGVEIESSSAVASEAAARNGFNEGFVKSIYRVLLLREPDHLGLENAMRDIATGKHSLVQQIKYILSSKEFKSKIIRFLKANITQDELNKLTVELTALKNESPK